MYELIHDADRLRFLTAPQDFYGFSGRGSLKEDSLVYRG
jgi:hypothetical protein